MSNAQINDLQNTEKRTKLPPMTLLSVRQVPLIVIPFNFPRSISIFLPSIFPSQFCPFLGWSQPAVHLLTIFTRWRLPSRRSATPCQRKVEYITPRLHKLPQAPANLHRKRLLSSERINLPALYKDDLVLRILAVIHSI
jgi:hypothetical protein